MKKMRLVSVVLAVVFVFALVMAGCGQTGVTTTTDTKTDAANTAVANDGGKQPVVALSLAARQNERWAKESDAFKAECEKLGAKVVFQDANQDENLQANQIENLISQKVDALVIVSVNSKTIVKSVEAAKKAGIPVMGYSRLIKDTAYDCFIGFDVVDIGRALAKAAIAKVAKGNYIIVNGAETDINAKFEHDGYMEVIKPLVDKGDIKLVSDQWVPDWDNGKALAIAENALTQAKNDVQAALVSNDGMAGSVVQALKAQKLDGKVFVTGTDGEVAALQRIAEGTQSCTLLFPSQEFATAAAQAAVEMAKTKKTPAAATGSSDAGSVKIPTIFVNTILVTKDNINDTVIKSGFAKLEDVFKNVPKDQWPK